MPSNQNQDHHRHNDGGLLNPGDFSDRQPRPHGSTNAGRLQRSQRPYWKRAHRDWRLWALVILMIAGMGIYLMTGDLRWRLNAPPQPVVTVAN